MRNKFRTIRAMDLSAFLDRCDRYCARRRLSRARLSTILFGSGVTLERLNNGAGVTVRVLGRAETRLAELERTLDESEIRPRAAAA